MNLSHIAGCSATLRHTSTANWPPDTAAVHIVEMRYGQRDLGHVGVTGAAAAAAGEARLLGGSGSDNRVGLEQQRDEAGSSNVNTASPDRVVFYWRPGCAFCASLRRRLRRAGVAVEEINIWQDPAGAALVRGAAQGNETVPTVVVGSRTLVNPRLDAVLEAVRAEAPHLLRSAGSDLIVPSQSGLSRRPRWRLFTRNR